MSEIEQRELDAHRAEITADVKKLVEKYRAIFDWDVPDIDQQAADRLILKAIHDSVNHIEDHLLA